MKKVWIAPGCIVCRACEDLCPDVFTVDEISAEVRSDADLSSRDSIEEAAQACPVDVINYQS